MWIVRAQASTKFALSRHRRVTRASCTKYGVRGAYFVREVRARLGEESAGWGVLRAQSTRAAWGAAASKAYFVVRARRGGPLQVRRTSCTKYARDVVGCGAASKAYFVHKVRADVVGCAAASKAYFVHKVRAQCGGRAACAGSRCVGGNRASCSKYRAEGRRSSNGRRQRASSPTEVFDERSRCRMRPRGASLLLFSSATPKAVPRCASQRDHQNKQSARRLPATASARSRAVTDRRI